MAEKISWGLLPGVPRVMSELAAGRHELLTLLGGDWRNQDAVKKTAEKRLRFANTAGLANALRQSYGDLAVPEAVGANLDLLDSGGALAVVTGQQIGIFGGPLYTYYKALTCVLMAHELSARLKMPVVPLFWMETGDADFTEVNHIQFPDDGDSVRRAAYLPPDMVSGHSINFHILSQQIDVLREEIRAWTSGFAHGAEVEKAAGCYTAGTMLHRAFTELLFWMFGSRGLIPVNPLAPEISARGGAFWERVLAEPGRIQGAFKVGSTEVEYLRMQLQVKLRDDALPFMTLDHDGMRRRVKPAGEDLSAQIDGRELDMAGLQLFAAETPGRVTPAVLLRPILQDYLLPTLMYVGGPSEIAYLLQTGRGYDMLDIPRPLTAPRISATLVEHTERRLLDRHGWRVKDALGGTELMLGSAGHDRELTELFDSGAEQLKGWLSRIEREADAAGVNLTAEIDTATRKLEYQWDKLRQGSLRRFSERDKSRATHARRLVARLTPDGGLQERYDSPLYYLARYGGGFADALAAEVELFEAQHVAIDLEEAS